MTDKELERWKPSGNQPDGSVERAAERLMDKIRDKPLSEQLVIVGDSVQGGYTNLRHKSQNLVLVRLSEKANILEAQLTACQREREGLRSLYMAGSKLRDAVIELAQGRAASAYAGEEVDVEEPEIWLEFLPELVSEPLLAALEEGQE